MRHCANTISLQVLNNPAMFTSAMQFEITFECIAPLKEGLSPHLLEVPALTCLSPPDLEWKMIYVGSADDDSFDQVTALARPCPVLITVYVSQELESVLVGPVEMGVNRFLFQVRRRSGCPQAS